MNWRTRLLQVLGPRLIVVLAARGTILISGLLVSVITAHALGPSGRGDFFWVITFAGLVSQFSNFGLPSSNTYVAAASPGLLGPLVSNSLWASIAAGILSVPALVVLQKLHWAPVLPSVVFCVPALAAALLFFPLGCYLLVAVGRVDGFNICQIVANTIVVFATVIAWLLHANVLGFLIATTLARVTAGVVVFYALLRVCTFSPSFDWPLFKSAFRVSSKAYAVTLQGFIVLRTNVFMLQALVSSHEVGLYSIACQIADVMVLLPDTMALLLFPDLVRNTTSRWEMTRRAALVMGVVMAAACVCAGIAASPMVKHVFGQAYAPAVPMFLWMLPGVLCLSVSSILSQNLAAHGFPLSIVVAWSATVVFGLICAWVLVRAAGGRGAAVSYSLTYVFLLTMVALCTKRLISRGKYDHTLEPVGALVE